jgi:predicted O-linked N-acetylglucosamine transferase (SPINDLY family)
MTAPGTAKQKRQARLYLNRGQLQEAKRLLLQLHQQNSGDTEVLTVLGNVFQRLGNYREAASCYLRLLQIKPKAVEILLNLGGLYAATGNFAGAIDCCQRAIAIQPRNEIACFNLGKAYELDMDYDKAIAAYRKALKLKPAYIAALTNLGAALRKQGAIDEAIQCTSRTLKLNPRETCALNNLAALYKDCGYIARATRCYRRALKVNPEFPVARSGYLFTLNYDPALTAAEIYEEHKVWGAFQTAGKITRQGHRNNRAPDRRLRIGYVSPDLKSHSVACFIEALLARHNKTDYEILCYAGVARPDSVTERLRGYCDGWLDIHGKQDRAVAQRIYQDEVDILVDLAGHTADSRLAVFAYQPAPVQVNYLGYPNTSGLPEMDYRLTDHTADPAGEADDYHTEELIRLPHGFLCYTPPEDVPDISPPPVLDRGYITFGSFNNTPKLNPEVIELWASILLAVPGSRLILKNRALSTTTASERLYKLFADKGIGMERVELIGFIPDKKDHLSTYNDIDIALDTFPYNGTTTSCEALLMAVPVVALLGSSHAGRVGASLLAPLGLEQWIAGNKGDYMNIAVNAALNVDELRRLKSSLRDHLLNSSLCDGATFTRDVEAAYRTMWKKYCNQESNGAL